MPLWARVVFSALVVCGGAALPIAAAGPTPNASTVPYYSEAHGYVNALNGRPLRHRGEYFEVVSPPLRLRYAEVHNKFMDVVPLPESVVQRFAGRTMAITGFENQVPCSRPRRTATEHTRCPLEGGRRRPPSGASVEQFKTKGAGRGCKTPSRRREICYHSHLWHHRSTGQL